MAETEQPSTTEAALTLSQSRQGGPAEVPAAATPEKGEGSAYDIGPGVTQSVRGRPYDRKVTDPLYRPLQIFILDPSSSRLDGNVATVNVPYEPLQPGCRGRIFEADNTDGGNGNSYQLLDLNDHAILLNDGRTPSQADPLFHQQMVYTVGTLLYAVFKVALGRHPSWGFRERMDGSTVLRLRPYAFRGQNAYYDKETGEICFGYYRANPEPVGRNLPNGFVFTSLSHDIIIHETTHALLDGMRAKFSIPTGCDVIAFHEGFADLMAVLQRFSYPQVVERAIGKARGEVGKADILVQVARQFGETVSGRPALRTALDMEGKKKYQPDLEAHELGGVFLSAVFDAFMTIYHRRAARYLRVATGGTGILPPGELHPDLQAILADQISTLASQFQKIAVRAVDYCPPVDVELGEFLRAVITADRDLVPDDRFAYREAWIDAFGKRGIFPRDVSFLTEDSLLWSAPTQPITNITGLTFAKLRFEGDPGSPAGANELRRQAGVLGRLVTDSRFMEEFGLVLDGDRRLSGDLVERPVVESVRSSRRVGPDGQIVFDLVAEVTQTRKVKRGNVFDFIGGCTVIIGPKGEIRYIIKKSIVNEERLRRQEEYLSMGSLRGRKLWLERDGEQVPVAQPFRLIHKM